MKLFRRKRSIILIFWMTLLSVWIVSCTLTPPKPVALTVSSAIVYREVLPEITQLYKKENPNVTIISNLVISQILKIQIQQGVPADVAISAKSSMDDLQAEGLILPETRQDLTRNKLVLIVHEDSKLPISNFQDLTSNRVEKVALGTGKLILGSLTKETLDTLGIYEQVQKKGVLAGEAARLILEAVETKKVDAGITYATEAKLSKKVKIVAIAPESSHSPIIYPVAVIKNSQNVAEAQEFIRFLKSPPVAAVLEKYGFTVNP